jgi:hypothetical protein
MNRALLLLVLLLGARIGWAQPITVLPGGGGSGSGFPLTTNVSGGGYALTNLGLLDVVTLRTSGVAIATGGSATVTVTTNLFFVDPSVGNDATAQRGRVDLPWRTVEAAGHAASGYNSNVVWVRPGRYTLTNSAYPSSTTAPPMFWLDSGVHLGITSSATWAMFPAQSGTTHKTIIRGHGVLSDYGRTNTSGRVMTLAGNGVDVEVAELRLAGSNSINNTITYGGSRIRAGLITSSNNSGDVNVYLLGFGNTVTSDIDVDIDVWGTPPTWGGTLFATTPRVQFITAGSGYNGQVRARAKLVNTGFGIGHLSDGAMFHADHAYVGGFTGFVGAACSSIIGIPGGAFDHTAWSFGSYNQMYGSATDFRPYVQGQTITLTADSFVSFTSNTVFGAFLEHAGNGTYTGATNSVIITARRFLAPNASTVFYVSSEFSTSTLYARLTRADFPQKFLRRAEDANPFNIRVVIEDSELVQLPWTNAAPVFDLGLVEPSSYTNTNGPAGSWRNNKLELKGTRVTAFGTNLHINCLTSNNNVVLRNSFLLGTNPIAMSTGGFVSNNVFSYGGWIQGQTNAGWNVNGVLNIDPTLR